MAGSLETTFDLVKFIDEGYEAQSKYGKKAGDRFTPDDLKRIDELVKIGGSETFHNFDDAMAFRYQKVIEHMGHWIEEIIEARTLCPRRSWKNEEVSFLDNEKMRKEFIAELFDTTLFLRAVCAYAGISGQEFLEVSREKLAYNKVRPDHAINGNEPAQKDPIAELHGNCPSASFHTQV